MNQHIANQLALNTGYADYCINCSEI